MADKLRTQQQLEQLQARYVGTGHADTTRSEWEHTILRDSYSSIVGHPALRRYIALGLGESMERTRVRMLEKTVKPIQSRNQSHNSGQNTAG